MNPQIAISHLFFTFFRRAAAVLLCLLLLCGVSSAQQESYINGLRGDSLQTGGTFITQDTVFFNPQLKPTITHTSRVDDVIRFGIDEFSKFLLPDSFRVTLTLRVIYTDVNGLIDSIPSRDLTIDYNKNRTYKNQAIINFENVYKLQVKILDIDVQFAPAERVLRNLLVEGNIFVDRTYQMDCVNNAIKTISKDVSSVATRGELDVYWSPDRSAQRYDVEWAWVDSSALQAGRYGPVANPDPDLIFRHNATRVTVSENEYTIPLLYDGDGSLFFRVRGVQTQATGEVVSTSWSSDFIASGGLGRYDFTGHARTLNWQASTSFAEDGKRKSVVQYFDGSLRQRQTVTKDNTTQNIIIAETLYDKQGRAAIQVLPAPSLSKLIDYNPMFNVGVNGAEYSKDLYDQMTAGFCSGVIPQMDTLAGASKYYSAANPLKDSGYNRFIPDAHRYPFAQTQYTQDNTGRIYRQGGVDSLFQIGRGHETKYYYGSPEQSDLDALFGTEAGYASHYQKNMVRDANGQYSVAYTDMNGRTIATALAGTPPDNLQQLASYRDEVQTDNLLGANNHIVNGTTVQATKSLLVTRAGVQTFHYGMPAQALTLKDARDRNICYDCLYDLNITITDNCNNELTGGAPVVITKSNFHLYQVDTTCNTVTPMDTTFSVTLPEGEYNITKTLSISRYAMQYYHDSLFVPHNTSRTYVDIFREQMDSIISRFDCEQPVDSTLTYKSYRQQMLLDLTPPFGQYANTSSTILYQNEPYPNNGFSIFNVSGSNYIYQSPFLLYLDEEGRPDTVLNSSGDRIRPQSLPAEEFIAHFKDSWAGALLRFHPEYCLLKYYDTLAASLTWDEDFEKTDTYAEALAKGYLNPTGNTTQLPAGNYPSLNTDPLFSNTLPDNVTGQMVGSEALAALNDSLFLSPLPPGSGHTTITKWNLATIAVKCQDPSNTACFATYYDPQNAFDNQSLSTGDLDMAWRLFRGFYKNAKASWIDHYIRSQCGNPQITPPYIPAFDNGDAAMAGQGYSAGGSNYAADSLQAMQNMAGFYQSTCAGYVQTWWQQLAPCNYTAADSAILIPRLIRVCESGSDPSHILGSSSISPDSTYQFANFEEVISQYNDSAYNGQKDINLCNSYLITQPLPYEQSAPVVDMPLWSAPDSCQCAAINGYYTQYQQVAGAFDGFSDYVSKMAGVTLTEEELTTLRSACSGAEGYFTAPIQLPPAFQCEVPAVCASCRQVQEWRDSFMVKFPGLIPALSEPDTAQRNTNRLFASYMNYQSGFGYSAQDYLAFMDSCSIAGQDAEHCSSQVWTVFNPGPQLHINSDLYDEAINNVLPVSQFFSGGIFTGPGAGQADHYILVDKTDVIAVTDSIAIMQWRVKPASATDMVNPVIQTGSHTYVGAEWHRDPADTNWYISTTTIRVRDGLLTGPGLQSNSSGLLADWVKIISGSTSAVLFYDDFPESGNCTVPEQMAMMLCGKTPSPTLTAAGVQDDVCADSTAFAIAAATQIFTAYKDSLSDYFYDAYTAKCLEAIGLESFTVEHRVSEYHYTLYYYDRAGNLVKTIPPEGVHPNRDAGWLAQVTLARAAGTVLVPEHSLPTVYRYNSLNQVVSRRTPDAGVSAYWYDRLGRLAISRNAQQQSTNDFSYTLYDALGRITEVGQKPQPAAMTDNISRNPEALSAWLNYNNAGFDYNATGVTATMHDHPSTVTQLTAPAIADNPVTFTQRAYTLRNRVSYTEYYDVLENNSTVAGGTTVYTPLYGNYTTGTYYSYDIHGNVDTLLHDYRQGDMAAHGYNRFKEVAYRYDLISGKVNEVHYQPGAVDQFYHRYEYDAENRITDVYTSDSKAYIGHKNLEEHEAYYQYYKHGPLARSVTGQQQVQGMDYAYTLQGWLKGVNSTGLNPDHDMGGDGALVARDAYGFSLNYFTGDYKPVSPSVNPFPGHSGYIPAADYKPLYNGNISSMAVNIGKFSQPLLYSYRYDQLNRITGMDAYSGLNEAGNNWAALTKINDYRERISYDANGNILTYKRSGNAARLNMDDLAYSYKPGTNQLDKVADAAPDVAAGEYDKYNDIRQGQQNSNYRYDAIGNLISDVNEGITHIEWNVYGKIRSILKSDGGTVDYNYDAAGNRIGKTVAPSGGAAKTTWYVRDATGNVMAIYTVAGSDSLYQSEQHLYGSNRLGIFNRNINVDAVPLQGISANLIGKYFVSDFTRGNKNYELSNHLGNVLATVSDKKTGHSADGTTIDYYQAEVISANDYYPFGMQMPGRRFAPENSLYRYGFNGKELDKEVSATTTYDYGFRIYNPALGKFLSVDPITKQYPELTPYQFASNRPIDGADIDGLEYISFHHYANGALAKTEFYKMTDKDIKRLGGTTAGIHNSVPYGPGGKGIVHYDYDVDGNITDERWEQHQTDWKSDLTFHGLYSGPGSVTYDGKPKSTNYDFKEQPIDWADAIAKRHDMDYAKAAPIGYAGYLEDIRTVQADRDMVKRIDNIVAKNIPFTNWEGVKGIETPVRTSYSTEMDFSLLGQRGLINSLATYKQWKIDNNYLDISKKSKQTFNNLKREFYKAHPSAAAVLDAIP